jgi:hypothetical protein
MGFDTNHFNIYLQNVNSGAGAVEFIISHAEVSIAFVEEKKIPEVHLLK